MNKYTRCKHCKRIVRWVKLPSGNWITINLRPQADGNILVCDDGVTACLLNSRWMERYKDKARRHQCHSDNCSRQNQPLVLVPRKTTRPTAIPSGLDGKSAAAGERDEEDTDHESC